MTCGTAIDLILVPRFSSFPAQVVSERIGASDHRLVTCHCSARIVCGADRLIGKVSWQAGDIWNEALKDIDVPLCCLDAAIQEALQLDVLRPSAFGGNTSKKVRRNILDAAAWARNVLIICAGHFSNAVRVHGVRVKRRVSLAPSHYASHADFKAAVRDVVQREQHLASNTYSKLRAKDKGQADRFLSSFFNKDLDFQVCLLDKDTGATLSDEAMLATLEEDMMARACNQFPADDLHLREIDVRVTSLRRSGGSAAGGQALPQNSNPYSEVELEEVLLKCQSSKKCLHGNFSVLKSPHPANRRVVLGLANLSRHVGLTSTLWSLRQFAHIRKSGSRIVRKVECLRPISLVADMTHIIDGLWLARNRKVLEDLCWA